ncbi:MAG: hypothetical protein A2269_07445 [Lentisphaerae bacterium RIFOXYA12_FULL_60_10]|nr:MAG: hypothetical protein A2269_07445 [Lentisphaerae bacterium RIFOXYA12_FULL_60_10]
MRFHGGYLPRVAGRPSSMIRQAPVPDQLVIHLRQGGMTYHGAVGNGETVAFGSPLAWAEGAGGRIALPAPATGVVSIDADASALTLKVTNAETTPVWPRQPPERIPAEAIRESLACGGLWPLIWSSRTGGMPMLDGSEEPRRILVNFLATEPFRTRGKVVLQAHWEQVLTGLRYLSRLLAEYGLVHLVLTEPDDPVAHALQKETTGQVWMHLETAPLRYPVEHPRVLCGALRRGDRTVKPDETIWILDAQAVQAVGACLGEGLPLHERIVAVGGPGAANPGHLRVRIGTPLDRVLDAADLDETRQQVLRGGLMRGTPVQAADAVKYDDDAFFVLPRPAKREFLGFVNPGFDRVSILPCFASRLTGAADRTITASLRGERRPCIACGLCEEVCPRGLLPQVLHRYLYRDAIDEAERTGLPLCIGCGLCSYVCPSKIELRHEFAQAQDRLRREHAQAQAVETVNEQREESRQHEKEHSEDWRK